MRKGFKYFLSLICFMLCFLNIEAAAAKNTPKSKFYDFSEQLIDGERKKPSTLYLDSREKVKFDRLMKLKKSFLPKLFLTAKEKVFK